MKTLLSAALILVISDLSLQFYSPPVVRAPEPECRKVPKEVCQQVAKVKYETVTRKECQEVADAACANVQERNCQISQRPLHQDSSSFIIRKNPRSILKKVHRLI